MEVEGFRFGILWRPCTVLSPHIRSCFEDIRFRKFGVAIALEVLLKERKENVLPIIFARVRGKIDSSQMLAVITCQSAMHPGSNHQRVEDPRIVLVDRM